MGEEHPFLANRIKIWSVGPFVLPDDPCEGGAEALADDNDDVFGCHRFIHLVELSQGRSDGSYRCLLLGADESQVFIHVVQHLLLLERKQVIVVMARYAIGFDQGIYPVAGGLVQHGVR